MVNDGGKEEKFGSPDGGGDGDHNGAHFVEISEIFAMQDVFVFGAEVFD